MLVDTTFWIDLLEERARPEAAEEDKPAHSFLAAHRGHSLRVSIIAWGELAAGVESYSELYRLLKRVRVLSSPIQVAWEASRIDRELSEIGERLGENDTWIAATARAWGMPLVSRDEAFRRVPRLRVIPY
jgi:predicted nucleic acid-binding protein